MEQRVEPVRAVDARRLQQLLRHALQARDIDDHHVADLLPAHEDDEAPEAEARIEQDARAVADEDAVKDRGPDVAEHDAADQVRHKEHRAEHVGAADAARERVGHGERQHVDQHERHDRKQRRVPEGVAERRVGKRLGIVGKAVPLGVARGRKGAEREVYALAEGVDKTDCERGQRRKQEQRKPFADSAADHVPVDGEAAPLALRSLLFHCGLLFIVWHGCNGRVFSAVGENIGRFGGRPFLGGSAAAFQLRNGRASRPPTGRQKRWL